MPLGLFVAVMIFGSIASNSPEGQERSRDRQAIESCWDQQKRKSLDPATARFVAATCERLESDFRTKHQRNP